VFEDEYDRRSIVGGLRAGDPARVDMRVSIQQANT
jgi:hypothetical protein